MDIELDSFFFKNGRLVRKSANLTPLKKEKERQIKIAAQRALIDAMKNYLEEKASASLLELAYAHHANLTTPPRCLLCGAQTQFGRNGWATYCDAKCQMLCPQEKTKRRETSLVKTGVIHAFVRDDVKAKRQERFAKIRKKNESIEALKSIKRLADANARRIKQEQKIEARLMKQEAKADLLPGFVDFQFGSKNKVLSAKHEACGSIFHLPRTPFQCYKCHAPAKESAQWNFTSTLDTNFERNKRIADGKFQLDAYWKVKNLAVEYNGLYWHSSAPKPGKGRSPEKFYHQNKMLAARNEGIRLITVWEDDARKESFRRHVETLFCSQKIWARKCEIVEIDNRKASAFLALNHRSGAAPGASKCFGLMLENELVMVATFGRNRFRGEGSELYRLSTKMGVQVVGGVSKIIAAFRKQNTGPLTTYADASWGWGDAYEAAGARRIGITLPGYFYFDQKTGGRIHRLKMSRGAFERNTGIPWDPLMNEEENAARVRCWRVWDCGNWKFEWP